MKQADLWNKQTERMVIRVPQKLAHKCRVEAARQGKSINLLLNQLIEKLVYEGKAQ